MEKHLKIIIDLIAAIETITWRTDTGAREGAFKPGVDLNEYIGDDIEKARAYIKEYEG